MKYTERKENQHTHLVRSHMHPYMHATRAYTHIHTHIWVYVYVVVCVCAQVYIRVSSSIQLHVAAIQTRLMRSELVMRGLNLYLLWTRYTGDSKTDPWEDPEIRTGSCSEDQTAIRIQNRVISCECLLLYYWSYMCITYFHTICVTFLHLFFNKIFYLMYFHV